MPHLKVFLKQLLSKFAFTLISFISLWTILYVELCSNHQALSRCSPLDHITRDFWESTSNITRGSQLGWLSIQFAWDWGISQDVGLSVPKSQNDLASGLGLKIYLWLWYRFLVIPEKNHTYKGYESTYSDVRNKAKKCISQGHGRKKMAS